MFFIRIFSGVFSDGLEIACHELIFFGGRAAGVTQTYRKKSRLCTFWFLKQMACSLFFCVK